MWPGTRHGKIAGFRPTSDLCATALRLWANR